MNDEVLDEIIDVIAGVLEIKKKDINLKTNLVADLDLESLDFVDIIVAFEEKYNMEIPDKDVKDLQTVEDIYNYVMKRRVEL